MWNTPQSHKVTKSQSDQVTKWPSHKVTKSQWQTSRTTGFSFHSIPSFIHNNRKRLPYTHPRQNPVPSQMLVQVYDTLTTNAKIVVPTIFHLNWSGINLQVGKPHEDVNIKIIIIQPNRTTCFWTKILVAGLGKDSPPPASGIPEL